MLSDEFKARLKHRGREVTAYLHARGALPSEQVRAVIFGQGRTGSTLLESLLASTGHFDARGEMLSTRKGEILWPRLYVHGLSRWRSPQNLLFHLKVYHLTRERRQPVDPLEFALWLRDEGWQFVHLHRRNKLKHALSNIVMRHRGGTHKLDDAKEELRVAVDVDEVVKRIRDRYRWEEQEREVLAAVKYVELVYEDDLLRADSHQGSVDRVLQFLSLEPRPVHTRHRKVVSRSLRDTVVNYDELQDRLEQHGWQHFLDEE